MTTRNYRKHSLSKKLKIIDLYEKGYGSETISKELKIAVSHVKILLQRYRHKGIDGLKRQVSYPTSFSDKVNVVRDILEKSLSYNQVAIKHCVSVSSAYSWTQKVREEGFNSLRDIKRGRPLKDMKDSTKKGPVTALEKLEEEVKYLRAENAYLKKLKALVQERMDLESGKKSELSKS